jgi:[ribosomal protein S18]-alanine N-acetyltransferase
VRVTTGRLGASARRGVPSRAPAGKCPPLTAAWHPRCGPALRHNEVVVVALYPIVIEEMTVDDIPAVQLVENASFPVPWPANAFRHELTQNRNAHYIVAREGEQTVGYAGLWLSLDEAHITTFAVLPEHRRRKIGERMLVDLFARAEKLGAEWLTLEVRASNLPAQKLYEKYGFRPAGIRRRYYSDNNEDAIIMWTERLRDRSVRDRLAKLRSALE